jgi:2-keto-3-deoxy-L-rhamnonate aldolase RhmA
MKSPAIRSLRDKLAADRPTFGLWVTLESASITEMAVGLGLDWVVIDAEHGHLGWNDITQHIRATVRSETVALVRVQKLDAGIIKRVLDIGADGIVIPWVETAEQLRFAVECAHYPPRGIRGIGGERATAWGQCLAEHVAEAEENVIVMPIIESVKGGENVSEMLEVDGVDCFYFGPADYSATAGFAGEWEGGDVAQRILTAKDQIRAAGKHCGLIGTSHENLIERREQGFQLLGFGLDSTMIIRSIQGCLNALGIERSLATGLDPNRG